MLPNGPLDGRPGFGSHVSNWLGAPHSHNKIHRFPFFFTSSANAGELNNPAKLVTTDPSPAVPTPCRNLRRCRVCSSLRHSPGSVSLFMSQ